jgi:hypothetical protein
MADTSDKAASVTQTITGRGVVPFTSGIFAIYAFFWPESFGTWFGTIIHAIRTVGGF